MFCAPKLDTMYRYPDASPVTVTDTIDRMSLPIAKAIPSKLPEFGALALDGSFELIQKAAIFLLSQKRLDLIQQKEIHAVRSSAGRRRAIYSPLF